MYFCKLKTLKEIEMRTNNDFIINFSGLAHGEHVFDYRIDSSLFKEFENEDILDSDINAKITLLIEERMLSFNFAFKGKIIVLCDLCLEEMSLDINTQNNLYVKFAEEYSELDDEIITLPLVEHKIDLINYIYEYILLAKPMKCSHKTEQCNVEMLNRIKELNAIEEPEDIDPRWEALKNIKID